GGDGLHGMVGELHRRPAVGGHHFADDREGVEPTVAFEPPEIVGEQGAPAVADAHAAMEMFVDARYGVHVQTIGEDQQLLARVLMASLPPGDGDLSRLDGVTGIGGNTGPTRYP